MESPSKRKRQTSSESHPVPSEEIPGPNTQASSPRSKVAYTFQGLHLSSPVRNATHKIYRETPLSPSDEIRKRIKVLKKSKSFSVEREIPETPQAKTFKINFGHERSLDPFIQESADGVLLRNEVDPFIVSAKRGLSNGNGKESLAVKTPPSNSRIASESKPRSKQRSGTPPLQYNSSSSIKSESTATSSFLDTDPDQAALTWHDDEITGHLLDDPEDDGEGINGIGFKPTAAQAYQRVEKRRQQMADYKTRETREARAKRGAKRRGGAEEVVATKGEELETSRRVRFLDADEAGVQVM